MKSSRSKTPSLNRLVECAVDAAHASGRALMKHFGGRLEIREKKGAGLVTNADVEAEEKALKILRKGFPEFGVLAEESAPNAHSTQGRWIIDPLDGTTNFVHGFPMFCVSIAAEWEGEPVVGVIYHPVLKDLYIGVKGKGATVNGKKLQVSKTAKLSDSLLTTGFSYTQGEKLKQDISAFGKLSEIARAIRRPGSAALDLAYTARGIFDGFWERNLSAWDIAAGAVLVREAGGIVSDYSGADFKIGMREVVASNPKLQKLIVETISADF